MNTVNEEGFWLRWIRNSGWLLVVAFALALPFKHLFELPMGLMALCGLSLVIFRPQEVMAQPLIKPLLVMSACIWLPMLASLPDAIFFSRAAETALVFLRFPLAAVFTAFALQSLDARQRLMKTLGIALSFSALGVVAQALFEYAFKSAAAQAEGENLFTSLRGLGFVMAALSPVFFYWVWQVSQKWRWAWLLLPVYLVDVFLSGRRAAWIMLMVGLLIWAAQLILVEKVRWRWKPLLAGVVFSALAIAAAMQLPALNARVGQTAGLFSGNYAQANAATSQRLPIWKVAVRVVEDHWINGIGPRGFRYIYPQYGEKDDPFLAANPNVGPNHPHQLLLEIATETGLIGVIGYLAALIYWVRLMLGTAREKKGVALSVMGGVLIAIMPINAHMAFYASFWSCITWWLMMLGLALWQTAPAEKHP